jgi:flagellar biosynthesis protein FliP
MSQRHAIPSMERPGPRGLLWVMLLFMVLGMGAAALGQDAPAASNQATYNFGINLPEEPRDIDVAIRVVFILTLLALAPSLLMLMTCFTRILIVFHFLRTALSLQGAPANQLMIGFALFLTFFIMAPTYQSINTDALQPYSAGEINSQEALARASDHMRTFMLQQARPKDVEFFVGMARIGPTRVEDLPMRVVIPGFVLSELRTGFQMGFLLFLPFILIDFVVAIVLMSLGLLFLPPMMVSLPLKILLFVLVDGWTLLVRSLALSFGY